MIGMILVDNMGPDDAPWWLAHAEWNGLTPADPYFSFFSIHNGNGNSFGGD